MANSPTNTISTQGIQLQLLTPPQRSPLLAPTETKGIVYTKRWVVELLLELSSYSPEKNLVDALAVEPAAGNGAFLCPMIHRLIESCRKQGRPLSDCLNSLLAYELDETSAARARHAIQSILVDLGVQPPLVAQLAESWITTKDYLLDTTDNKADFVVGNPPYIRLEDIPEENATIYRKAYPTMRGRADLYVAFFEAALRQLTSGGVCAFICADRWMRNQYGSELRHLITSSYSVELILGMHDADPFDEEVDAYPAITIIRHRRQSATVVAKATSQTETIQPKLLAATLQPNHHCKSSDHFPSIHIAVVNNWFKGSDPWPCHSPEQLSLLRQLEDTFPPLEMNAKVGIGVATGNDSVYITTDPHLVESSRLLKLAVAKDLASGTFNWSGHYLVNPWNKTGLVQLSAYPKLKTYFEHHAKALKKRHIAENKATGWYKTIDRINHSLIDTPKLYIPDIKNSLEPVLDPGGTYPHHNLYFIQSDDWDLEVLGGLLLSTISQFFVEAYGIKMRGGYLRFQAQYLRRIRVPPPVTLSKFHAKELKEAFRYRNRQQATTIALDIYGIDSVLIEAALGR